MRIALADADPTASQLHQTALGLLGHDVLLAPTGRQLIELCRAARPDLIVTEARLPDADGLEAAREAGQGNPLPVVLVCAAADPALVGRAAAEETVAAFLVKPLAPGALAAAVAVALARARQAQALRQEATGLRQALEDRKVIERAKGALMKRIGLGEEEAFRRLRTLASARSQKLAEVARSVLEADRVFEEFDRAAAPGGGLGAT